MLCPQAFGELGDHVVVLAALAGRLDHRLGHLEVGVAARGVEIVVLEEHRGRQHDIGEGRRLGQELLMDAGEEVLAPKTFVHQLELGADHRRVGVLNQQRRHRRTVLQGLTVAGQDRPEPRLVELADRGIDHVETFDQRPVEGIHAGVAIKRATALVFPRAGHRRQGRDGVHVGSTIAAAAEAVMAADERGLGLAVEPRERNDLLDREAGDLRRPLRRARGDVGGKLVRRVGIAAHIVPVGIALLEEDVHDTGRQRPIGAGTHREMDVGLLGRTSAVGIDHDQLRAALLGAHGVGHDVDLGVDRIAAPDHDQLGMLVDLAHVGAALGADARDPAGVGERDADGREVARVFHRVAQPVDAVSLHQPHRAGVVIGPHRLAAVLARLG